MLDRWASAAPSKPIMGSPPMPPDRRGTPAAPGIMCMRMPGGAEPPETRARGCGQPAGAVCVGSSPPIIICVYTHTHTHTHTCQTKAWLTCTCTQITGCFLCVCVYVCVCMCVRSLILVLCAANLPGRGWRLGPSSCSLTSSYDRYQRRLGGQYRTSTRPRRHWTASSV